MSAPRRGIELVRDGEYMMKGEAIQIEIQDRGVDTVSSRARRVRTAGSASAHLDFVAGPRAEVQFEQLKTDLVSVGHADFREGDRAKSESATAVIRR
jgi:hypothetical protein